MAPFRSLTSKITLAVSLLVAVYLCAIALVGQLYFEGQLKKSISDQQFTLVSMLAEEVDRKIIAAQQELVAVAGILEKLGPVSNAAWQELLERRADTRLIFDNALGYLGADGTLLALAPRQEELIGRNFAYRGYFQKTLATGKPQIAGPLPSEQPHHPPILVFTAPLHDPKGRVSGVLVGSIDLLEEHFLGRMPGARSLQPGAYFYIFDRNRQLIVHPDRRRIMNPQAAPTGNNPGMEKALVGFEGSLETEDPQGRTSLAAFKRLPSTGWILATDYPMAAALAPLQRVRAIFWPALAVAVLLSILLFSRFVKHLTRPLQRATSHIRQLSLTDDSLPPLLITSRDEIGTLSRAFNQLLKAMEHHKGAVKEQLHFIQVLLDTLPNPIFFKDAELRYLGCNRAFEDYLGLSRAELVGKGVHEIAPADLATVYEAADRELLDHRQTQIYEGAVTYPDGSRREVIFYKAVFFNAQGQIGGIIGTFLDISDRKRAEQNLLEQKEFSDSLLQNSAVPTFVIDTQHRILTWNRACEALTGLAATAMLGSRDHWQAFYRQPRPCLADLILDNQQPQMTGLYRSCAPSPLIPGGWQAESWFRDLNGQNRYLLFSAAPIRNRDGEVVAVIETFEDQTAQRQALEQLNKLGQAVEQSPGSVIITDARGVIEYVNPKCVSLSGYSAEELLGRTPAILKSGHTSDEEYRELWETIRSGRQWRGEFLNQKKKGELFWEAASISPVRDRDGLTWPSRRTSPSARRRRKPCRKKSCTCTTWPITTP